jgi:hypothetical protein
MSFADRSNESTWVLCSNAEQISPTCSSLIWHAERLTHSVSSSLACNSDRHDRRRLGTDDDAVVSGVFVSPRPPRRPMIVVVDDVDVSRVEWMRFGPMFYPLRARKEK